MVSLTMFWGRLFHSSSSFYFNDKIHQTISPTSFYSTKFIYLFIPTELFLQDWNNLPSSIIESNNIDSFSAELQTLKKKNHVTRRLARVFLSEQRRVKTRDLRCCDYSYRRDTSNTKGASTESPLSNV